jgi:hypothetical protein
MNEGQIYQEAARIIMIAMGTEKVSRGRGRKSEYRSRAEQDPLGHSLGVEDIVALVKRAASKPT